MKVQAKAQLNHLRMSPQKVRLVAGLIRGLKVDEARAQLMFNHKRAAQPILKLLDSAIANAEHNHDIDTKTLVIETIYVNEGPVLRRWMPRAMGRATPMRKRSSHTTLVLSGELDEKKAKKVKQETEKTQKQETKDESVAVESKSKTKKVSTKKTK
ncbi:MAG TPA: 50S ribosomal protein L22 [Candidatus Magasanikbacteria bacterium]|nr:MAG: 50S ribosomal protein L22 [Candidatus Magasanikbacteria bacterium RIFOXYC2_FULL_39_8]HAT03713.1 50S ribosomal protein L22 [Candidatus Magasanikbacteria bacterium]